MLWTPGRNHSTFQYPIPLYYTILCRNPSSLHHTRHTSLTHTYTIHDRHPFSLLDSLFHFYTIPSRLSYSPLHSTLPYYTLLYMHPFSLLRSTPHCYTNPLPQCYTGTVRYLFSLLHSYPNAIPYKPYPTCKQNLA